jgi:hypothetical protein
LYDACDWIFSWLIDGLMKFKRDIMTESRVDSCAAVSAAGGGTLLGSPKAPGRHDGMTARSKDTLAGKKPG